MGQYSREKVKARLSYYSIIHFNHVYCSKAGRPSKKSSELEVGTVAVEK